MSGKITVDEITLENPDMTHQYGRTLDRIEAIALRKKFRKWMTKGEWYFGETGSGKSHIAYEGFSPETHYVVSLGQLARGFWTGYTGQEVVIINEFRGQISFGELMDLVDKWPKSVDVKCKEPVPFLAKRFIITGPKPPAETYSGMVDKGDSIEQLYRRFKVYQCVKDGDKHVSLLQDYGWNEEVVVAPPAAPQPTLAGAAVVVPAALKIDCPVEEEVRVRKENPFTVKLSINGGQKLWGQTKLFGCQGIKDK